MASTLKINTLTGVSTAGSIAVTGEGNSTTTNLQQGLTKCWCKFNGEDSTPSFSDSFNMASITDNGTGDYTVNITNDMANDDYSCTHHGVNRTFLEAADEVLVGSVRFVGRNQAGNATDINEAGVQICGDLA